MMIIDLHSHSVYSDGTWRVEDLLLEAERKKIRGFSITDHDTLTGSYAAEPLLSRFSGVFIPGTELSVEVKGLRLHLLAHFPSFKGLRESTFNQALTVMQQNREERMQKMIQKAQDLNLPVTMDDVLTEARNGKPASVQPLLSRPHLARVLVKKKIVASVQEAFNKYLDVNKPLYVPKKTYTLREWFTFIKESKGLITWAHPLYNLKNDFSLLEGLTKILLSEQIDGLELYYKYLKYPVSTSFLKEGLDYLFSVSREHDLVITVGGDFHGDAGVLGEIDYPLAEWDRFKRRLFQ